MDFLMAYKKMTRNGIEIRPKFLVKASEDLMIRGGDFFAVWDEENGLWSTSEQRAIELIDRELDIYAQDYPEATVMHLWDADTGMIDKWHKFCKQQLWDHYVELDSKITFNDSPVRKEDYASKRLKYSLKRCETPAYDELINTLYSMEERMKIEWAIGAIISGDSVNLQKFLVLYGDKGTGKSTILNIIQKMFDGYWGAFDSKALGSARDFALESLKDNPLVAIQHDGDLSRIEDNTLINSLVSHEIMVMNVKHKNLYQTRFNSFLIMGTNKPVRITDSKSGILRRLIDVSPTGNKVSVFRYWQLMKAIDFELGGIAQHCLDIYLANKNLYDNYIPAKMMGASNDFYNYIQEVYDIFMEMQQVPLKTAWDFYKKYCDDARVPYPLSQRVFKEELKIYFYEFAERATLRDGTRVRNLYSGFRADAFETTVVKSVEPDSKFVFTEQKSVLDDVLANYPAQYATKDGKPKCAWDNVDTTLKDLDTTQLHYVRVPENHIVIDFDIPDSTGNKSFIKNLEAANKFPLTYAELSKSGNGIHLHYLYSGDVSQLSSIYGEHIEIKVFTGKSSLRRKLTKCNNIPIATISSGLPLVKKKVDDMLDSKVVQDQRHLENIIKKALKKDIRPFGRKPYTALCCQYIKENVETAYNKGISYDIRPMREEIMRFASNSHHQANECVKMMMSMHWHSDDIDNEKTDGKTRTLCFFDVEVFPNLLIICWKIPNSEVQVMINPEPAEVEKLCNKYFLIGFNNRRYDNHILYARILGYNNAQVYNVSKKIISGDKNAFFIQAYNLSGTDIYDFMANKMSLKKLEIEMGILHDELGMDWNKPVPEEMWEKVASYCCNDVKATEAAFDYLKDDWEARKILAKLANGTVNQSTNTLSTKFIFGDNKEPQNEFNYRDLSKPVTEIDQDTLIFLTDNKPDMMSDKYVSLEGESFLPYYDGYKFENGKSTYRGEDVGEGGYVYAEPGIYHNVALLDIASMHPNSIVSECLFGPVYTKRFKDILDARIMVKHGDLDALEKHMGGEFKEVVDDIRADRVNTKALAYALKIVINSIYGLTAARFANSFKDPRNIDNIVAKRGALFMVNLKHEVQKRGFTVAHIKTDSIKIPDATPEIIDFVMEYGKKYGYSFEHEATYERMCLINDAVYIAKYDNGEWTATGKQFKVPYVFKSLFDKSSPIEIKDMAEVKSSQTALYLDMNEGLPEGEHNYMFIGKVGQFTPVKAGFGGGELVVKAIDKDGNEKYDFAQESKGYKWKETANIDNLEEIDREFYINKVDNAKLAINEFGDFVEFMEGEIV